MLAIINRQARNFFIAQGIFAILAGLTILVWPNETTVVVAYIFAGWLFADAIVAGIVWASARNVPGATLSLGKGILQVLLAFLIVLMPDVFATVILAIIAVTVLLIGFLLFMTGIMIKPIGSSAWIGFVLSGILAIAGAVVIMVFPRESGLAIITVVAVVLLFVGAICLGVGFRFGSIARALDERERAYSNPNNDGRGQVIEGTVDNDDNQRGIQQ